MKKVLLILVAVIGFVACHKDNNSGENDDNSGNKWVQKKNYPGAQNDRPVAFSVNNKIYALSSTNLWEYNPTSDTWTEKSFPNIADNTFITTSTCFVINNKAYIIDEYNKTWIPGGSAYNFPVWEYNPIADDWTKKTACPIIVSTYQCSWGGTVLSHSNFGFSINNKGYAGNMGGAFYEYNPETNTWKQCANAGGHEGIIRGATEEHGFTIGGRNCSYYASTFRIYNPDTDKWTPKANFPTAIQQGIAFCKDGVIYAGLGSPGTGKDIYKYNNDNNSWNYAIEAPIERSGAIAVMCNGKLYLGLGGNIDFWEYTF